MSQTSTKHKYKTSFILDTRGYEEPVDTLIDKLKQTLEGLECEIDQVQNLGQKEFARVTDKGFPQGIFIQFDYQGPAEHAGKIREKLRLDKTVYRTFVERID